MVSNEVLYVKEENISGRMFYFVNHSFKQWLNLHFMIDSVNRSRETVQVPKCQLLSDISSQVNSCSTLTMSIAKKNTLPYTLSVFQRRLLLLWPRTHESTVSGNDSQYMCTAVNLFPIKSHSSHTLWNIFFFFHRISFLKVYCT